MSDETALRDEIFELKRQVMVLRRTNEQNLVKLRKLEEEAKRKDREIEQLMDPRKNADVTKVLSTKGAAILMTLKDQKNALIQMVLNKDLQIRRLLAEMKMSKLSAYSGKNVSYKEEIVRLKHLLVKSQEILKEYLNKENEAKSAEANENSFLEFPSSSGQSSPRDLDELRLAIRSLETHIKYSNELLNKKDQEISVLNDEMNFLKKLLQHKTSKNEAFDCHPNDLHKYSVSDTHSVLQTRVSGIPHAVKISAGELHQLYENKDMSSSAPASSTRLPPSSVLLSKPGSFSNVIDDENWTDSKIEPTNETKALLRDTAAEENEAKITPEFGKVEKVREPKILTKHGEPKKRFPKKFRTAKKKKFYENDKKNQNVFTLEAIEPRKGEKKANGRTISKIFKIIDSKKIEEVDVKFREKVSNKKSSGFDKDDCGISRTDTEDEGIQKDGPNLNVNRDSYDAEKESEKAKSVDSSKNLIMDSSEIIEINLAAEVDNSKMSDEETNPVNCRREIYRQSFESENGCPTKQQVQQVQVEVQMDSILIENDGEKSENFISGNSHQGELADAKKSDRAPDDKDDNNNDDDNDVIIR